MSTEPDPKAVQDLAQQVADRALHDNVHLDQWITDALVAMFGEGNLETRVAYHPAVARRLAVVKAAWPDEQIARIWFYEDDDEACSPVAYTTAEAAQAAGLAEVDPQAAGPDADPELAAHYAWQPLEGLPRYFVLTEDGQRTGYKVCGFDVVDSAGRAVSWPDEQLQDERDARPLIERLPPQDAERVAALIDERDCWRKEVLELREQVKGQADLATELDAANDDADEIADQRAEYREEIMRLRAEVADFPEQLADAQEVALDKLVTAFGEGWDAQRGRGIAVTQYSNSLPWPTYAAPQQPAHDGADDNCGACVRMRQQPARDGSEQ